MTLEEKLREIQVIKNEITRLYTKLNPLKKEVVKEMVDTEIKALTLDKDLHATLVWVVEKKIDYDRLMRLYGDIYLLGLKTTFSKTQALNSVSSSLLNKILKDCTKTKMGYELKIRKEK